MEVDRNLALQSINRAVVVPGSNSMEFVRTAAADAYDRLIAPSMEREIRNALTESANEAAIHNFALNLKPLLLQPPVKGKVTMGLDPGYRNGCKVAVVDGTGKVLDTAVVYPTSVSYTHLDVYKRQGVDSAWTVHAPFPFDGVLVYLLSDFSE